MKTAPGRHDPGPEHLYRVLLVTSAWHMPRAVALRPAWFRPDPRVHALSRTPGNRFRCVRGELDRRKQIHVTARQGASAVRDASQQVSQLWAKVEFVPDFCTINSSLAAGHD